jgi:hypothetical protein
VHGTVLTTAGVGARVADVRNAPAPAVRTLTRSRFVAEVSLSGPRQPDPFMSPLPQTPDHLVLLRFLEEREVLEPPGRSLPLTSIF